MFKTPQRRLTLPVRLTCSSGDQSGRSPLSPKSVQSFITWSVHFDERVIDQRASPALSRTVPRDFCPGDRVVVHNVRGSSMPATVIRTGDKPRSYLVEFDNGTRSVRNRIFVTPLPRSPPLSVGSRSPPPMTTTTSPPPRPQGTPPVPHPVNSTPSPSPPLGREPLPRRPLPQPASVLLPAPEPSSSTPALPTPPAARLLPLSSVPPVRPSAPASRPPAPAITTRAGRPVRPRWKLWDR
jgi:hypothetical protein